MSVLPARPVIKKLELSLMMKCSPLTMPSLPPYLQHVLHLLPTPGIFPILVQIRLAGLQVAVHMRHGSSVCCGERGLGKP